MRLVGLSRDDRGQIWATLGGIIDEVQAAGRVKLEGWVDALNKAALRWASHGERYRALLVVAGAAMAPPETIDELRGAIDRADSKRSTVLTVRDWLYATLGEVTDVDTFDVTDQRGVGFIAGALGALTVPVQIAALLAGTSLTAFVAYQVRASIQEGRLVEQRTAFVNRAAQAKTPQEREAYFAGLNQVGAELRERADDGGLGVGHVLGFLLAVAAAGFGLKKVLGR